MGISLCCCCIYVMDIDIILGSNVETVINGS